MVEICLISVYSEAVSALACIISENLIDSLLTKELLTPSRYVEMIDSLGSAGIDNSESAPSFIYDANALSSTIIRRLLLHA